MTMDIQVYFEMTPENHVADPITVTIHYKPSEWKKAEWLQQKIKEAYEKEETQ